MKFTEKNVSSQDSQFYAFCPGEHTPDQLGMEDGDVIDALIEQTGGA